MLTLLLPDFSVQFQSNQRAVAGRTFQLVGLDSQLPRRSFQLHMDSISIQNFYKSKVWFRLWLDE